MVEDDSSNYWSMNIGKENSIFLATPVFLNIIIDKVKNTDLWFNLAYNFVNWLRQTVTNLWVFSLTSVWLV